VREEVCEESRAPSVSAIERLLRVSPRGGREEGEEGTDRRTGSSYLRDRENMSHGDRVSVDEDKLHLDVLTEDDSVHSGGMLGYF